jgi:hypothetical protein
LHVEVPDFRTARLSSGDLTDVAPTEYRADAVVTLDGDSSPVLAVVVEVQLRIDPRKRRTWPVYVATLHARVTCPVVLLVICAKRAVAEWCAVPIVLGPPGNVVTPVVLGPGQVPVVTDAETAVRHPELAVLSAMAHGAHPDPTPVFAALVTALNTIDLDHADLYTQLVLTVLPTAARNRLEEFMTTTSRRFRTEIFNRAYTEGMAQGIAEGKAQGIAEGKAQGIAEGKAEGEAEGEATGEVRGEANALLAFLEARGIEVTDEIRARILGCTDLDQLGAWIRRAATADKIDDLGI